VILEFGDVSPDAEIYIDVVKMRALGGSEAAEWEVYYFFSVWLFVKYEHGSHVAEEGLHEEFIAWEDTAAAIYFRFL